MFEALCRGRFGLVSLYNYTHVENKAYKIIGESPCKWDLINYGKNIFKYPVNTCTSPDMIFPMKSPKYCQYFGNVYTSFLFGVVLRCHDSVRDLVLAVALTRINSSMKFLLSIKSFMHLSNLINNIILFLGIHWNQACADRDYIRERRTLFHDEPRRIHLQPPTKYRWVATAG